MTYHATDVDDRFEAAIHSLVFPREAAENGTWAYMYSDDRFDYFKHAITRKYVKSAR